MSTVTKEAILEAVKKFNIESDSILLVHSSLKALGYIEGGADTVIDALKETVSEGTLVMPTLSQKNWETVFEDWSLDRPSDTGFITEVFRLRPDSLRSDNATHSVAASGTHAADLVGGDPKGGARPGIFGDYCFSSESPWQRMFDSRTRYGVRAYVMFWGCTMKYNTFKHFSEYRLVEKVLGAVSDPEKKEALAERISRYGNTEGKIWPWYNSGDFQLRLEEMGIAKRISLGQGEIVCCDIFDAVSAVDKALVEEPETMMKGAILDWLKEAEQCR